MSDLNPDYLAGLAQLETEGGRKTAGANNLYNIKDFSGGGTRAYDKAEKSNDAYRVYASHEESTADLMGLLGRKYPKALTAQSPEEFATALKEGGYATDPNYVAKLTAVIKGGKFNVTPSAPLRAVGPAFPSITEAGVWDATVAGPRSGRAALNTDSDGNQVNLTPLEKQGVLLAGVQGGPESALAARHDVDAAAILGEQGRLTIDPSGPSPMARAQAVENADRAAETAKQAVSWQDRFGAASLNDGFIRSIVRKVAGLGDYGPADPAFKVPEEVLAGKNEEQMRELGDATNAKHLAGIMFEQSEADERAKTLSTTGAWGQFGFGALASLQNPLSYAAPYAVARGLKLASLGSAALAAEGRAVPAALASFAENAGGSVIQEQIGGALVDEHRTAGDVAGAMAFALVPGALHGLSAHSAGQRLAAVAELQRVQDSVTAKAAALYEQAMKNLGPDASEAQIVAEADRIHTAEIKGKLEANVAPKQESEALMPHPDEIKAQLEAEAKAALEAEKPATGEPKTVVEEEIAPISAGNEGDLPVASKYEYNDREATAAAIKALGPNATPEQKAAAVRYKTEKPLWDQAGALVDEARKTDARNVDSSNAKGIAEIEGVRQSWLDRQQAGVHALPEISSINRFTPAVNAVHALVKQFLPKSKIAIGIAKTEERTIGVGHPPGGTVTKANPSYDAIVYSNGDTHFIGVRSNLTTEQALTSVVHEVGHAVFHEEARNIPPKLLARMVAEHGEFLADLRAGKATSRFARFNEGSANVANADQTIRGALANTEYNASFDEYTAEAFTRYIQRKAREGGGPEIPQEALTVFAQAWNKIKALWERATAKGYVPKNEAFEEFFDRVLKGTLAQADDTAPGHFDSGIRLPEGSMAQTAPTAPAALAPADTIASRYGLDLLPEGTPQEAGEKRMMIAYYQRAEAWARANPKDVAWDARTKSLTDNSLFNVASTGLLMLKSENPAIRWTAYQLLEDAGGVAGSRHATAAISKHTFERLFIGNTVNDLQSAFESWKKVNGGSTWDDLMSGQGWDRFNRSVAEEIEGRRQNGGRSTGSAQIMVMQAADSVEKAYERMRGAQIRHETLGWAALPETSAGYMPHKMLPSRVRTLSVGERGVLTQALTDQFITIEGFDMTFAQNLAGRYMDRVVQKALGGYDAPIGQLHQTGAADIVEDAMRAMGLSRQEIAANMQRYYNAGPGHTKARLSLDLLKTNTVKNADGTTSEIRLLDLFSTDQMHLIRQQAGRVSGEVALARFGVYGKPGMALLRRAMGYGEDSPTRVRELEAFDQVTSEFFSEPFGTSEGKWMERARTMNSVARLGGIVFNQFAEFINGIAHVGVGRTLGAVGSIGRLRSEIIALSRGQVVDNPLISSIEHMTGAEFGTDAYKLSFPFDSPDAAYPTYGRDTITATDRLLRGGAHLQSKLSFWRAIHSAQNRGFAEQIVQKAAQFIKSGADDAALNDMGIHAGLRARLAVDLPNMAVFDNTGKLVSFDLMKARDVRAAEEFAQAVLRGTSQIIQSTFIGETGKWAHSGYLKMLTQFRTFSITSVEKQWARQRNNQGTAKALGILVGSMSIAVPVYMARVYASSIGRKDQDAYLERELSPYKLTRATMNYVALSGLAGDFADALTAVAPDAIQEKLGGPTGGRTGTTTGFVGNLVAPSAGYVDDVWGALQNLDKPEKAARILPFSRHPLLVPAINALGR